jgi:hypothetical protein
LLGVSATLTTLLALPGSAYYCPGYRSVLGPVLPILLLDVIIDTVIHLVVPATAYLGDRCTCRCTGNGAMDTSARL